MLLMLLWGDVFFWGGGIWRMPQQPGNFFRPTYAFLLVGLRGLSPWCTDACTRSPPFCRCLFHYWSPQAVDSAPDLLKPTPGPNGNTSGVAAVRCGKYKAHFYVRNTGRSPPLKVRVRCVDSCVVAWLLLCYFPGCMTMRCSGRDILATHFC